MRPEQAKEQVKALLETYLIQKGINTRKPFHCLNPEHPDKHPSMSLDRKRNKAHCFSCGADYDTFNLVAMDYGLTDSKAVFAKAYEIFFLQVDFPGTTVKKDKLLSQVQHTSTTIQISPHTQQPDEDFTPYYTACHARLAQTDYLNRRGISTTVANRFQLGFDPAFAKGTGGVPWQVLIIPTSPSSYVVRNTEQSADSKNRYRKQGPSLIFNCSALLLATRPVFVVEGEIDALSVVEAGGEAIGLGSTANVKSFLRLLQAQKPMHPLLLALDNAPDGDKASAELAEGLRALAISFYVVALYGPYKDANEALLADRDAFVAAILRAEHLEDEAIEAERQAYFQLSAADHLQSFVNGIAESVDTPAFPTGFSKLDAVLDGGLYEGLYIFGAISSLGKTTFIIQMADQIAQQNMDVVIFSLEMARSELMAKSISRHTLLSILEGRGDICNAKTTRSITSGKRYLQYSKTERELIHSAVQVYRQYADRLFISEGIGNLGVADVRETVRKHVQFTGRKPVVVIDYLQILAPHNERMTDKQNMDKAVMELKRISRDYKIPVVGISSFNRVNYKEAVTMEAFKESGAIEYSSDILIGLQLKGAGGKDFNANEEKRKNPRAIELVILKNRNGATGVIISYEYYPMFNYFKET